MKRPELTTLELPRGGSLVEGDEFRLQIGAYPETIKDTMKSERGVPDLYLLPDDLFDTVMGVSNSDLEFPLYFNYYIKQQKCRFICHAHQVRPLVRVLREAIFGPFKLHTEREYPQGRATPGYPDLRREMQFYKEDPETGKRVRLKDMIDVYTFDDEGRVKVDGVTVTHLKRNSYRFEKDGGRPLECTFKAFRETPLVPGDNEGFYVPPVFGVTVIGSGHGFDAESMTSGFIIWIDGKGILVDPPVNTTIWLKQNRVNTRLIEDLILTHCHADHDSGTVQKVLEEGRIQIHTTETVMDSFVAKYSALTQLHSSDFRALFEFLPVMIGKPTTIAGARFWFKYNLHPIPTIGFVVEFEGETFYYSCDTLYEPDTIRQWQELGVLSPSRADDLLDVPWDSTLILHEAGIPPIHTPISVLADLPSEVKERVSLVHVSQSAIPADSGLKIAEPGTANTQKIPVPTPQKSLAYKILDVAAHVDLFTEMKFKKALECLAITHYTRCDPGEVFIKRDTYGDKFYMILSGEVEVLHESLPQRLFFGRYDYIGETAIILNQPRNADIVAHTLTELLYIEREDFLRFVRDTPLPEMLKRLDENRTVGARWTFEKHRIMAALSPLQMNQLMCSMVQATVPKGESLYQKGDRVEWYYLIDTGEVYVRWDGNEARLGAGTLLGEFGSRSDLSRHSTEAGAATELELYKIAAADMKTFFNSYPGTFVRLAKGFVDTLKQNQEGTQSAQM